MSDETRGEKRIKGEDIAPGSGRTLRNNNEITMPRNAL